MTEITILVPQIEQVGLMPNPADVDSSVTASFIVSEMQKRCNLSRSIAALFFQAKGEFISGNSV